MNNSKGFKVARIIGIVEIVLSLLLTIAGAFPVGIPLLLIGIFIVVGSRKAQKKNLEIQQNPPQLQPEPPKEKENTLQTSKQESDIARAAYNSVMEKRVKNLQCDLRAFNQILKNAQQWPGAEKQMLLSCINQMYSLKKTPDPMEKAAFEKIKVSLSTN